MLSTLLAGQGLAQDAAPTALAIAVTGKAVDLERSTAPESQRYINDAPCEVARWQLPAPPLLAFAQPVMTQNGPDMEQRRYEARDPLSLTAPRRPITRKDYVDFVRPWAEHYEMTSEADPWDWRHGPLRILPPLAVFALEGDLELGRKIKQDMRAFAAWVDQSVKQKGVVFCLDAMTFSVLCFDALRQHNLMTEQDEQWAKTMLLKIRQYHAGWAENGPWDGWFRGSQHRAQVQGSNNAIAAFLYPDEPDAAKWMQIADTIWGDWWSFRDVGINDMWYFHSALGSITRTAYILKREEVFTDPESRRLFQRILFETSPEGSEIPYGASCGYNVVSGSRIVALELAARYTRDGRYRWAAHRLMNNCQARPFCRNSPQGTKGVADIAVASLVCDDSIKPAEPEGGSKLLVRKEIVRLNDDQARIMFPDFKGVDCNMYMTQKVMPSKLAFRSGWNPGDLYMLVECYVRHDPLNPTAIIGLERYGVGTTEMASEKFVPCENAVTIVDRSGTATYLGQKDFKGEKKLPLGWAGMSSDVPVFSDHALASHARIDVTHYQGYEATQQREFLFVKNRFVLVRDETAFHDTFRTEVGPIWNTQHVGNVRGKNWINTWFSGHYFEDTLLFEEQPWDLLVWYVPRENTQLKVMPDKASDAQRRTRIFPTQYSWEGNVQPDQKVQFTMLLLPHALTHDTSRLVEGITVLAERVGLAAVQITEGARCEIAVLNPEGTRLELNGAAGRVCTDSRVLYMDFEEGKPCRVLVMQGTLLEAGAQELLRRTERTDYERQEVIVDPP
jgi:hypothetical protein